MIYKGIQRKMIMLKNTGSEYFDEAYFIIKDGIAHTKSETAAENDMIKEANRIISDTFRHAGRCEGAGLPSNRRRAVGAGIWYAAGVLCGMAATFILNCLSG